MDVDVVAEEPDCFTIQEDNGNGKMQESCSYSPGDYEVNLENEINDIEENTILVDNKDSVLTTSYNSFIVGKDVLRDIYYRRNNDVEKCTDIESNNTLVDVGIIPCSDHAFVAPENGLHEKTNMEKYTCSNIDINDGRITPSCSDHHKKVIAIASVNTNNDTPDKTNMKNNTKFNIESNGRAVGLTPPSSVHHKNGTVIASENVNDTPKKTNMEKHRYSNIESNANDAGCTPLCYDHHKTVTVIASENVNDTHDKTNMKNHQCSNIENNGDTVGFSPPGSNHHKNVSVISSENVNDTPNKTNMEKHQCSNIESNSTAVGFALPRSDHHKVVTVLASIITNNITPDKSSMEKLPSSNIESNSKAEGSTPSCSDHHKNVTVIAPVNVNNDTTDKSNVEKRPCSIESNAGLTPRCSDHHKHTAVASEHVNNKTPDKTNMGLINKADITRLKSKFRISKYLALEKIADCNKKVANLLSIQRSSRKKRISQSGVNCKKNHLRERALKACKKNSLYSASWFGFKVKPNNTHFQQRKKSKDYNLGFFTTEIIDLTTNEFDDNTSGNLICPKKNNYDHRVNSKPIKVTDLNECNETGPLRTSNITRPKRSLLEQYLLADKLETPLTKKCSVVLDKLCLDEILLKKNKLDARESLEDAVSKIERRHDDTRRTGSDYCGIKEIRYEHDSEAEKEAELKTNWSNIQFKITSAVTVNGKLGYYRCKLCQREIKKETYLSRHFINLHNIKLTTFVTLRGKRKSKFGKTNTHIIAGENPGFSFGQDKIKTTSDSDYKLAVRIDGKEEIKAKVKSNWTQIQRRVMRVIKVADAFNNYQCKLCQIIIQNKYSTLRHFLNLHLFDVGDITTLLTFGDVANFRTSAIEINKLKYVDGNINSNFYQLENNEQNNINENNISLKRRSLTPCNSVKIDSDIEVRNIWNKMYERVMKRLKNNAHQCIYCQKRFKTKKNCLRHYTIWHVFDTTSNLTKFDVIHLNLRNAVIKQRCRLEENLYKCDVCAETSTFFTQFMRHYIVHFPPEEREAELKRNHALREMNTRSDLIDKLVEIELLEPLEQQLPESDSLLSNSESDCLATSLDLNTIKQNEKRITDGKMGLTKRAQKRCKIIRGVCNEIVRISNGKYAENAGKTNETPELIKVAETIVID